MEITGPLESQQFSPQEPSQDDIDEYRRLSAEQAAGVAVVSTVWKGRDYAATVSAYLSVSYDPPTMLVSLYEGSRIAQAVAASGQWALTILTTDQRRQANWLASPGTPVEGLLAQVPFRRGPATGCAVLDGGLAYFEAATTAVHEAATHLLVVGEVVSMGSDAQWHPGISPLLHYAGDYRSLKAQ
ncbi:MULTISPECIES: flavin reductase family protein [unclassified Arthrobacter]|uniref:flavin reductase family protein n=1 Tax=unclassified Arthrobacter TaxID=235627 RepID=UPI00159EB52E|nr:MULTISPECIES: flavin reductase family protein [unclassified Arthrobacter]MCQ9163678.1 flavin reductase family protein [Arthrobacter sp. STN4]NVM99174.1 flavin reductase [Arthrobacter sp. SDTb3-6]